MAHWNEPIFKGENNLTKIFPIYENYIYFHHTNTMILFPTWPDQIQDSQSASWGQTNVLGRSAPIQSYQGTGARSLTLAFSLHREELKQSNVKSGFNPAITNMGEDYLDILIKQSYASVLPVYGASAKMVDPPLVSVRVGNNTYIKGVIKSFSCNYGGSNVPVLRDGKYATATLTFNIEEVNPYDAITAMKVGSFRSDGEILMSTELNKSSYMIGQKQQPNTPRLTTSSSSGWL